MLEGGWPRLALMNPTNPAGSKSLCLQCDVDWRQVQGLFAVVRQEVQDFGKIRFGNFVGITCLMESNSLGLRKAERMSA